jgi:hypothetical protein
VRLMITLTIALTLLPHPAFAGVKDLARLFPKVEAAISRLKALKGSPREALAEGRATLSEFTGELSRAKREQTESIRKWADRAHDLIDASEAANVIRQAEKRRQELEDEIAGEEVQARQRCMLSCGDNGCVASEAGCGEE